MKRLFRLFAVLVVGTGVVSCDPTYPNGVIKNRGDAISAWRRQCAHEVAHRYDGRLVATLHNDEWTVGYHDASAIVMAVFDAKSGKMKRCYFGVRN
jgi:nitrite reductase/ring-hydroxylating ferredoxin subunit